MQSLSDLKRQMDLIQAEQDRGLSRSQLEYEEHVKSQYAALFSELQKTVTGKLEAAVEAARVSGVASGEAALELVKALDQKFTESLKKAYEEATAKIKFSEIEYKRTITKKRKEFSRKNAKEAKPQRVWRYIDEE